MKHRQQQEGTGHGKGTVRQRKESGFFFQLRPCTLDSDGHQTKRLGTSVHGSLSVVSPLLPKRCKDGSQIQRHSLHLQLQVANDTLGLDAIFTMFLQMCSLFFLAPWPIEHEASLVMDSLVCRGLAVISKKTWVPPIESFFQNANSKTSDPSAEGLLKLTRSKWHSSTSNSQMPTNRPSFFSRLGLCSKTL